MAVYKFLVTLPVDTGLPRDQYANVFHMDHVGGVAVDTDLDAIADDVCDLYQSKYASTSSEVRCRVYALGPSPQYPKANRVKGTVGAPWTASGPREVALCLSYAANRSNPSERGRMYLSPGLRSSIASMGLRPTAGQMAWALGWYATSNDSFPDLGGIDWKFGVWSPSQSKFTQTTQAWVDDEWDTVRSRGTRPTSRQTSVRDG